MGSKTSKKKDFSRDEFLIDQLVSQTSFKREQLVQMHSQFLRECPNGRLSKKDFVNMFLKMQSNDAKNLQGTQKYYEYVFNALDQDDSGYIDFSEFIIAFSMISPGSTEEKIRMAFRIFDLDHDGKLHKKEVLKVIESLYNLNTELERKLVIAAKARVDLLFKKLDEDGNHFITMDEFFKACFYDQSVKKFLIDPLYRYA